MQSASFAVQAYPFSPDMLAVLGVLAEEAGEPPIEQLLKADMTALHTGKEGREGPTCAVNHTSGPFMQ